MLKEQSNSAAPSGFSHKWFLSCLYILGYCWESGALFHLVIQGPGKELPQQGSIMHGELGAALTLQPGSNTHHFCSWPIEQNKTQSPAKCKGAGKYGQAQDYLVSSQYFCISLPLWFLKIS